MRRLVALGVTVLWVGNVCVDFVDAKTQAATPPALLDGTYWVVTVTPDGLGESGGEQPFEDTLLFQSNTIVSTTWAKRGITAIPYTGKSGPQDSFKGKQASAEQGKMVWAGEASGTTIHGTINWTKRDGTFLTYRFDGKRTEKPATK